MQGDDNIIILGSRNLDEDGPSVSFPKDNEDASREILESQGIFLEQIIDQKPISTDPSKLPEDFQDMSGIEILPNEESDFFS